MGYLDFATIILFTLIILVVGLSFGKQGGDLKSFFAAGGAVPWGINGLSLFMSFFSAGTFVVWGSIAYEYGLVAITIQMMMCLAGFLIGRFIAPKWRETNALTVAEYLTNRFGIKIQRYYTYLFLFLSLGYTGAFLYPVAKIVNVSTGLDIYYSIILLGGIIMVYTAVGGLWAVVVTDVLQFVILTAAVLIVVPLSLDAVDGFGNFVSSAPDTFFNAFAGEYTPLFIVAFCLYNLVFIGGNWAYVQRYTSARDKRSASKVGYLFGGLYLISPILWMLPPMIYRVLEPGLSGLESEGAYLLMCQRVLPAGAEERLVEEDRLEAFAIHRKERSRRERQHRAARDRVLHPALHEMRPLHHFHLREQPVADIEQHHHGDQHGDAFERLLVPGREVEHRLDQDRSQPARRQRQDDTDMNVAAALAGTGLHQEGQQRADHQDRLHALAQQQHHRLDEHPHRRRALGETPLGHLQPAHQRGLDFGE